MTGTASPKQKLWVDDERPAPDESWDVAKSATEATTLYDAGDYRIVSLDYSLGSGGTGEDVIAHWKARQDWPGAVRLHSSNSLGRTLLAAIIGDCFPHGGGPTVVGAE